MIEGRWLKGGGVCPGAVCADVVVWDNFISRTCYALTPDATLLGIGTSIIKMQPLSNNQPGFADMGLIRHPKLESSADGDKHKVNHMQWWGHAASQALSSKMLPWLHHRFPISRAATNFHHRQEQILFLYLFRRMLSQPMVHATTSPSHRHAALVFRNSPSIHIVDPAFQKLPPIKNEPNTIRESPSNASEESPNLEGTTMKELGPPIFVRLNETALQDYFIEMY
jgi:hypothetical protein